MTGVRQIQHFRHMKVTNQSDTWQDLTRVKPRVTSAEASMIGTVHLRDRCRRSRHRRHIGHREIGVPEVEGNRTSEVPKSRHNRDRPSERTHGRRLVPSAKGPTGGRSSANQKSGYRRSRAQRFCAFRNRDPRNPDEWGTTVSTAAKEDRGLVDASCQR
jgi:hypothetical protein